VVLAAGNFESLFPKAGEGLPNCMVVTSCNEYNTFISFSPLIGCHFGSGLGVEGFLSEVGDKREVGGSYQCTKLQTYFNSSTGTGKPQHFNNHQSSKIYQHQHHQRMLGFEFLYNIIDKVIVLGGVNNKFSGF
jgi:hypothetical protein